MARYSRDGGWDPAPDSSLDSDSTLLLAFADSRDPAVLQALDTLPAQFPQSVLMGCSTAGEIAGDRVSDGSISLAVIRFDRTRLRVTSVAGGSDESLFVGRDLAARLDAPDLRALLVLSEGLKVNGSLLVEGVSSLLGDRVVVTGGLAGDATHFESTWVWTREGRQSQHVVAVGFYGDAVRITHGSRGGWEVLSDELEVTHAIGNVLYELNDRPALDVYKEYLGEHAAGLPATGLLYPLAIPNDSATEGATVRTILSVDEQEKSITFAGDMPDYGPVNLMRSSFDGLIAGAAGASRDAMGAAGEQALVSVAISCVGRRLVLDKRTDDELSATQAVLPPGSVQIGFYSYGEISPLANGACNLHNQTMTLTLICED